MDFNNKVVLITGASSGIGAAAALLYAQQSAKVVLVGRNEESLCKVAKQCEETKGIRPLVIKADLSVEEDVKNIVTKTVNTFNQIDVLVNNAGVGVHGSILDGVELYDRAMAVNVRAAYLLTSLAAPYLIKTKGNIVNVSSVAGLRPIKDVDFLPYCMSKAALDQFTKCLAVEMARHKVRVNSVNPGGTKSQFAEAAGYSKEEVAELYKHRCENYPLGKLAESEEVADLILYLSSNRARSITGSIYVIDNGEMLV
ncbi:putative oxidoreductase TM_0325 [Anticarsia gemmatalis]|uniref:putative oxidoreductase TM_0325 n=1 Tax=Anticarsia gemmatalis TaxID=129554 RepID=UPI003F759E67